MKFYILFVAWGGEQKAHRLDLKGSQRAGLLHKTETESEKTVWAPTNTQESELSESHFIRMSVLYGHGLNNFSSIRPKIKKPYNNQVN